MFSVILIAILVVLLLLLAFTNLRIVPQGHAYVIERLGAYSGTWMQGLHLKIPFIERVANKVSLKEHVVDFPPQPVITRDNVTINIDTVVYFQITDPKLFTYGAETPMAAIENLTATTLRNIIGELVLDDTLTSRDTINGKIRVVLDEATDPWGIKINRVEVKNIDPPREIQAAMEKQMRAEREKREAILKAEGQKQSAILVAEGNKESAILQAAGEAEAMIKRAEAEAESIKLVQEATALGIKMIAASNPTKEVLTLKSLEAFETAADGRATKLIIPSELQGIAGLASTLTEIAKDSDNGAVTIKK